MEVLDCVRRSFREKGLHGLLVTSPDNVRYLTGFMVPSHARNRHRRVVAIINEERLDLLLVSVEESFAREVKGRVNEFLTYDELSESPMSVLAHHLQRLGLDRVLVGVEMDFMPAGDLEQLQQLLPAIRVIDAHQILAECRRTKSDEEVFHLRRAAQIADVAYRQAAPLMRVGMTEHELGSILIARALAAGAESARLAALATGARSAHINAGPTDRTLQAGEILRVDLIVQSSSYFGDIARTLIAGDPEPHHRTAWKALIESRDRILDFIKPGRTAGDIFNLYESTLNSYQLEPWLGFVGHGIGLSVHEAPVLRRGGRTVVEEGDVLCIEPTVKVTDAFGLHVEEQFSVGRDSVEIFTDVELNRDLLVVRGGAE